MTGTTDNHQASWPSKSSDPDMTRADSEDMRASEQLMTVDQVAAYLQCSPRTVRTLIERGELVGIRIRRLVRVEQRALRIYISQEPVTSGGHCASAAPTHDE